MKTIADTLIIGAGLAGLVAARTLQNQGYTTTVLEKEHTIGGSLATRQMENSLADCGAQFFTCRTETFQQQVDEWLESGLVYVWSNEWSDGSIKRTAPDGRPRYTARGGMYKLTENLADGLDNLRSDITVTSVQLAGDHWLVTDKKNRIFMGRTLVLTLPVPQSLALLEDVPLNTSERNALERIYYAPCLCGLFTIEGEVKLPPSGAVQNFGRTVYWIADNQVKGLSSGERIITMHLNKRYSEQHFNDSEAETLSFLQEELQPYLKPGAVIKAGGLKKWQYSIPLTTYPHDILQAEDVPLIFSGAAFGGRGRIEGAYVSGLAAGQAVEALLVKEPTTSNNAR